MKNSTLFVSAAALILTGAASAQFTGAYAPGTWTTSAPVGGSAAFAGDGSSLTMTGPDGGIGGNLDVTHTVVGGGTWTFDWSWQLLNSSTGFDSASYLINGVATLLPGTSSSFSASGSVSVAVSTGDVIGWRVNSVDGIFGPGVLTITDFQIPAPGALALLGVAGLAGSRRRRA